jgi:hypothetical protein
MKRFGAMPNQPLLQKPGIVYAGRRFPDGSPHARRRQPWVLETGVAALPTVAKLMRGFDGIVQKSRILPHAVGLEWQGFSEGRTV